MSYYILPINGNIINVNPKHSIEKCKPCISLTLFKYYNQMKEQIIINLSYNNEQNTTHKDENNHDNDEERFNNVLHISHVCEFILKNVPGTNFSVSKLKPVTNIFYDFFELFTNLNLAETLGPSPVNMLHISKNNCDIINCFEILRENIKDNHVFQENVDNKSHDYGNKFNFIFYEIDNINYFESIIRSIITILKNQHYKGNTIIKMYDCFHKPVIDALYFLSSLYETVYICKPSTNNQVSFDKYIVCKKFKYNNEKHDDFLKNNYNTLIKFINKINMNNNYNIVQLLDINIPHYFKTRIDDINIINGRQQLESLGLIHSLCNTKCKDIKFESIKKNHIMQSIYWCEKYKIPCNKFEEKTICF